MQPSRMPPTIAASNPGAGTEAGGLSGAMNARTARPTPGETSEAAIAAKAARVTSGPMSKAIPRTIPPPKAAEARTTRVSRLGIRDFEPERLHDRPSDRAGTKDVAIG